MRRFILSAFMLLALASVTACDEESGGSGGSAGGSTATGTGGSAPAGSGTCENTCEKSIALNCSGGEHDQATCVAGCEKQQANCSGMAKEFQTFLDCIESTPMKCGDSSGTPTSEQCISQGFAVLQCAAGS